MESIFKKIGRDHFTELASLCSNRFKLDIEAAYRSILECKADKPTVGNKIKELESQWYKSLKTGVPDFSVYDHPYYLCDIWVCWTLYSRKSLLSIAAENSLITQSVLSEFKNVQRIADLGCGFGYTTAGLKELFPLADVFGTNLKSSYQYSIAEKIGKQRGFKLYGSIDDLKQCDLVFASEYFEHIQNPIAHLSHVLRVIEPRYMVIANAFNGTAIGHFKEYDYLGRKYSGREMSKMFNEALRSKGYEKVKTKIWNNRPAIWVKQTHQK